MLGCVLGLERVCTLCTGDIIIDLGQPPIPASAASVSGVAGAAILTITTARCRTARTAVSLLVLKH